MDRPLAPLSRQSVGSVWLPNDDHSDRARHAVDDNQRNGHYWPSSGRSLLSFIMLSRLHFTSDILAMISIYAIV